MGFGLILATGGALVVVGPVVLLAALRRPDFRSRFFAELPESLRRLPRRFPGNIALLTRGFFPGMIAMAMLGVGVVLVGVSLVQGDHSSLWVAALVPVGLGLVAVVLSVLVAVLRRPRSWIPEPFRESAKEDRDV